MNPEIIQAIAAAVQAFAAVVVMILTAVLIAVTKSYVDTTRDQLHELRTQRTASYRPLIHGIEAEFGRGTLRLKVLNIGAGPAIDVTMNDRDFAAAPARVTLPTGRGEVISLSTTLDEPIEFDLPFVYKDLGGGEWLTTMGLDMSRPGAENRIVSTETIPRPIGGGRPAEQGRFGWLRLRRNTQP